MAHLMRKISAVFFISLSLLASSATADYAAGQAAYGKKDYITAMKEWRPLAEQGDVPSQLNLGSLYYDGFGVRQDYSEAARWYRLAAEMGDVGA
jgi:TPR repeat protein